MSIKRALVVEDCNVLFELIKAHLEGQNVDVIHAANSRAAMELLENNDFCLVTVDNGLPDIDGHKLIKQIRDMNKNIKIIMLTGTHTDELEKAAKENGADVFMAKDIDMHFLSDIEGIFKHE